MEAARLLEVDSLGFVGVAIGEGEADEVAEGTSATHLFWKEGKAKAEGQILIVSELSHQNRENHLIILSPGSLLCLKKEKFEKSVCK